MKPRDSMPTTRSMPASRKGPVRRSIVWRKAGPCLVRVVMSLNSTPGWGKSGTSRMRAARSNSCVVIALESRSGGGAGEAEPAEVQGGDEGAAEPGPLQGDVPAEGAHVLQGGEQALGEAQAAQGP